MYTATVEDLSPGVACLYPLLPQPKALVLETKLWLAVTSVSIGYNAVLFHRTVPSVSFVFYLVAYRVSTAQVLLPVAQLPVEPQNLSGDFRGGLFCPSLAWP